MVGVLLKAKASPNCCNKAGDTPLHIAAAGTDLEMVKLLVSHGANIKATNANDQKSIDVAKDEIRSYLKKKSLFHFH